MVEPTSVDITDVLLMELIKRLKSQKKFKCSIGKSGEGMNYNSLKICEILREDYKGK